MKEAESECRCFIVVLYESEVGLRLQRLCSLYEEENWMFSQGHSFDQLA